MKPLHPLVWSLMSRVCQKGMASALCSPIPTSPTLLHLSQFSLCPSRCILCRCFQPCSEKNKFPIPHVPGRSFPITKFSRFLIHQISIGRVFLWKLLFLPTPCSHAIWSPKMVPKSLYPPPLHTHTHAHTHTLPRGYAVKPHCFAVPNG